MIFRWTGSLIRTSELLSLLCSAEVPHTSLLWWAPYWRAVWSGVRSPSVAVFQLDAADSYSRSVSIYIPGQFISLLLFLSFSSQSTLCFFTCLLPHTFSPFYPQSHSLSSSCFAQSVSFTPQIHEQFFFRVIALLVLPSPFLSVHSLLEQTYEKSWQLSQRSFHKQHKASDNWSGCVAAGLSEGLALWVSNCSGSLAELRALHKLSVMWCRSLMACLRVRVCTRRKKKMREKWRICESERNRKRQKTVRRTKGEMIHYSTCHVVTAGFL